MTDTASISTTGGELDYGDNGGLAYVSMSGSASMQSASWVSFGRDGGSQCTLQMTDYAKITNSTSQWFSIGCLGATATATMAGHSEIDTGEFDVGQGGNGTLLMSGSSVLNTAKFTIGDSSGSGAVVLSGSATVTANGNPANNDGVFVGIWGEAGSVASLTVLDSATLACVKNFNVGYNWGNDSTQLGTNTVTVGGSSGAPVGTPATVTIGGTLTIGADGGAGTWNQQPNSLTTAANVIYLGEYDITDGPGGTPGSGILNLNGGTLSAPGIQVHSNASVVTGTTGTVNFNGGVLRATAGGDFFSTTDSAGTLNLNVQTGGALIDTNGNNVGISLPLVHASGAATDGGLTKLGSGTLTLTGANNYNGLTVIQKGVLELGSSAQNVVFNQGGADIRAGKLVFDYNGTTSPAAEVLAALKDGYIHGFTSGKLFTSTYTLPIYHGSCGLGWRDDGSKVTVQVALYGDCNLDGKVDFEDLGMVIANYGGPPVWPLMNWSTGDFNYDGTVDFSDLGIVIANYGMSLPSDLAPGSIPHDSGSAVPEPGTLAMLASALLGLLAYAMRK
jgi:autotransporter-associated beta strand protein